MPKEIDVLAGRILNNPVKIEITPVSSTAEKVKQKVYFVAKPNKKHLLIDILQDKKIESVLVFSRTKHGADKVVKILAKSDIKAAAIHGNKSQSARQRALGNFKKGELNVLIATDIAARGIDIDDLALVVNFDLPNVPETYVHRIGRTGRAGKSGVAISFITHENEDHFKLIQKRSKINLKKEEIKGFELNGTALPKEKGQEAIKGKRKSKKDKLREQGLNKPS